METTEQLIERAANLGVRPEFDCSLNVVKLTKTGDPERQNRQGSIITELWKYRSDVCRVVKRRAISARAKELAGRRIWSPEHGAGVLAEAWGNGAVAISINKPGFRTPQTPMCDAESLLIVLDEQEGVGGASSPHNDEPTSDPLLERAANLGVRLEFDCGFLIAAVKWAETGDPERHHGQGDIIAELGKHLSYVRRFVERYAISARTKELVGQRILSEYGEGVLAEASSSDGVVIVSIEKAGDSQRLAADAANLLILLDAAGTSSPHNDEPKSQQPRRGIFGWPRRGSRED
jgi:hypothetical protein